MVVETGADWLERCVCVCDEAALSDRASVGVLAQVGTHGDTIAHCTGSLHTGSWRSAVCRFDVRSVMN